MGVGWRVLVTLGLLAAVHSYQETKLEDVIGEYEFKMFKELFINTSKQLIKAIGRLESNSAQETSLSKLRMSVQGMEDAISGLSEHTLAVRDSVDDGADSTKVQLRMFQDQVLARLDEVQATLEHRTAEMEEQIGNLSQRSYNILAGDCEDLHDLGFNASGVYYLQKFGRKVLCDMESGRGGWLVVQRRAKVVHQVDFNRDWHEYKAGFGDPETEFWVGNDFLHVLTNQKSYELHINITDYEKGPYWASYSSFRVGSEGAGYPLDLGNYTGNATDAFMYHHGRGFTTTDRDNDLYDDGNCATFFSGGWWYDRCYEAHLNGIFPLTPDRQNASFITWWAHEEGKKVPLVLTSVTLKVRPRRN